MADLGAELRRLGVGCDAFAAAFARARYGPPAGRGRRRGRPGSSFAGCSGILRARLGRGRARAWLSRRPVVARRLTAPARYGMSEAYDLYQLGRARLREGMAAQATVPLEKARRLEPEKASIREALGIAYFRITDWRAAEREFRKVLELSPVDDYAHYALGRSLLQQGRSGGERPISSWPASCSPATPRRASTSTASS